MTELESQIEQFKAHLHRGSLKYKDVVFIAKIEEPYSKRTLKANIIQLLEEIEEFDESHFKELIAYSNGYYNYHDLERVMIEYSNIEEQMYAGISKSLKEKDYEKLKEAIGQAKAIKDACLAETLEKVYLYFSSKVKIKRNGEKEIKANVEKVKEWSLSGFSMVMLRAADINCSTGDLDEESNRIIFPIFNSIWPIIEGTFNPPIESIGRKSDNPGGPFTVEFEFKQHSARVINIFRRINNKNESLLKELSAWCEEKWGDLDFEEP